MTIWQVFQLDQIIYADRDRYDSGYDSKTRKRLVFLRSLETDTESGRKSYPEQKTADNPIMIA